MNKLKIDWNNKIPNKEACLKQLNSLLDEANYMLSHGGDPEIFGKDRAALHIAINIIKEVI